MAWLFGVATGPGLATSAKKTRSNPTSSVRAVAREREQRVHDSARRAPALCTSPTLLQCTALCTICKTREISISGKMAKS